MTSSKAYLPRLLPLADLVLTILCAYYAPWITNAVAPLLGWQQGPCFDVFTTTFIAGIAVAAAPVVLYVLGFYRRRNLQRVSTALRQVSSFTVYYLCVIAIYQSLGEHSKHFNHVVMVCIVLVPLVIFLRYLVCHYISLYCCGHGSLRPAILAGMSRESIEQGWAGTPSYWRRSFNIVARTTPAEYDEKAIQRVIEDDHVEQLIIIDGTQSAVANYALYQLCAVQGIDVYVFRPHKKGVTARVELTEIGDSSVLVFSSTPAVSWARLVKSLADRLCALVLLLLSSPLWLIVAIGIKISDPKGPVFFRQQRSGLYGRPFNMWKFRSMYSGADKQLDRIKKEYGNDVDGPIFKLENDPRIFPFGQFIRKTSLDELPQLLNILLGDMSIVGPRPLPTYETAQFPEISDRRRLSVKPGLTCYWQIEDRSNAKSFDVMREKDLKYIDNWSLWLDVKLFFRTIPAVLFGRGAK